LVDKYRTIGRKESRKFTYNDDYHEERTEVTHEKHLEDIGRLETVLRALSRINPLYDPQCRNQHKAVALVVFVDPISLVRSFSEVS